MRMSLIVALLAASALVPSAASAQDRADWRNGRQSQGDSGQRQQQPARPAPQQYQPPQYQPQQNQRAQSNQPPAQPQKQPDFGQRGGDPRGQQWGGRNSGGWQGGNRPVNPPQPPQGQKDWRGNVPPDRSNWSGNDAGNRRNDNNRDWHGGNEHRGDPRGGWNGNDHDWRDGNRNGDWNRGGYNNGSWNRDWRRDRNYDWNRYRDRNRYAYHLPRYYAPGGWGYGYRRFGIGVTLNSFLFGQDYWIGDPYDYRLPPAYGPYRWVRYYNDALLVDIRSGYVVDTVYDIFW